MVDPIKVAFAGINEALAAITDEAAPLVAKQTSLSACHHIIERGQRRSQEARVAGRTGKNSEEIGS